MRSLVKMLFITAILVYGSAYAQSTLIEDWESVTTLPSANWDIRFENPSTVYPFIEPAGNPGQALNPGGQGHLKSCIVYNTTFQPDYSIGMEIDFDAYLVSTGWHYTDITIDLMKDVNAWPANDYLVLRMHLNKNGSNERKVWMQLQSQDTLHTELMVIDGAYNSDAWNHGKIIIREDKRVEFFVNGTLLWTSTKTIDPAYSTSTKLAIGGQSFGGPARMDNLRVRNGLAGLVAYYRFAGNTLDATDYHNDVAVVAGAVPTADRMGNPNSAYQFDGNNDYLMIPDSPSLHSTRLSVAAWVKVDAIQSLHQAIVAKYWGTTNDHSGRSWTFELSPNDVHPKFTGVWSGVNTALTSNNPVSIGNWKFLVATYDGAAIRIYENGELTTTLPKSGDLDLGTHELTIGSTCTTGLDNTWFKGAIDEVMVFNRALSAEEVALLYEPIPDTHRIWVDSTSINTGYVDVMMHNSYDVAAFTLPLLYHSDQPVDSVRKFGCRTENWESFHGTIYSDTILLIGGTADFGGGTPCMSPGSGPIARIYFSPSCLDTPTVCFDTTYINEPGKLLVVECGTPPISHIPEYFASCTHYEMSLPAPVANAGADLELHSCENGTRSLPSGCADANDDIVSCELVEGPGTFDGQFIHFVPDYGTYSFVLKATDACDQVDYDTSFVTVLNCGDANNDCARNISDIVFLIQYIFLGGSAPSPLSAGDVDGSCAITISDAVYYINWIFGGGAEPHCACTGGGTSPSIAKAIVGSASIAATDTKSEAATAIAVNLSASSDVRAVQLDFAITGDVRNIQIKSDISALQLFHNEIESNCRVGLIDLTGTEAIPAGNTQIASITYEGNGELAITSAIVVDNDANEMNVEITNSKLETVLPKEYSLSQNQPNPFNPATDISFSLPKNGQVKLVVYNILGAEVATLVDDVRSAGTHRVTWDGTDKSGNPVASGVYLYRLTAGDFAETKKMVLMR